MKLHIKNFRSIKQLDLEIAPITVLYGHNGTGKSSALYAPLTMKNIVTNPNQHVQEFFNYVFASLGTFQEVVFDHDTNSQLELGISLQAFFRSPNPEDYIPDAFEVNYNVTFLNDNSGSLELRISGYDEIADREYQMMNLKRIVAFPEREKSATLLRLGQTDRIFEWSGTSINEITLSSVDGLPDDRLQSVSGETKEMIDSPLEILRRVSFVPLGRGFFHPSYSLQEVSPMIATEQEVTSMLAGDEYLEYKISRFMEQILNRDFRVRNRIGSNNFSLNSVDRRTGMGASLVNEGFGVNQLVFMFAKTLHPDAGIVCIEEPEIHLHPSAIRRLARALADIVREEPSKHLIISTHSKQFIMSLLALVAEGTHSPNDLAVYLVTKDEKASEFHRQQVNEKGQIEGGFASFIEGELEDMKAFLGV
ncbi:MAG: AAA family ATPase [Chloroflexi bacterium]|nr:AAA family ATPase [Chloroflexota bacterium]